MTTMATVYARRVLGLATLAVAALMAPSSARACVVGTGTGASCTEAALNACFPGGGNFDGSVTFSCGGAATIPITSAKTVSAATSIDGGGVITISGGHGVAVFIVDPGVTFTVQSLTIANGHDVTFASGIQNNGTTTATNCTFSGNAGGTGGAVYNDLGQSLTIAGCTFSGNTATVRGGAVYNNGILTLTDSTFAGNTVQGGGKGGALDNEFQADVTGCTFSGNTAAAGGHGGAIYTGATLTLANSTITGNTAAAGGDGGGIYNDSDDLTVLDCTISGNTADGSGGGMFLNGDATATNTIVAGNSGGNCSSFSVTDGGHNIDDGTTCGFAGGGCTATPGTSLCQTDPGLDPAGLADNGGPTQTIALLAGSPAIDDGDPDVCAAPPVSGVDQRGVVRPQPPGGGCDVGAFEFGATPASTTTTTTTITTTTTTPCGVPAPTFESIDCRLDQLIAQVQSATDLGKVKRSLLHSLTLARDRKVAAEGIAATNQTVAKKRLKVAFRKMISFNFRVRSLVARKTIPRPTRNSLGDQGRPIQKDVQTLLRTL